MTRTFDFVIVHSEYAGSAEGPPQMGRAFVLLRVN